MTEMENGEGPDLDARPRSEQPSDAVTDEPPPSGAQAGDSEPTNTWQWERRTASSPTPPEGPSTPENPPAPPPTPGPTPPGFSAPPQPPAPPPPQPPTPGTLYGTGAFGTPPPAFAATPQTTAPPPPRRGIGVLVAVAVAAGLIGGGIGAGVTRAWDGNGSGTGAGGVVATEQVGAPNGGASPAMPGSVAQVAQELLPSVVSITTTDGQSIEQGTGFVLSTSGYIATNNHVIAIANTAGSGANGNLVVTFSDGTTVPATVVGADSSSDLAVIKVSKSGLKPVVLGSSSSLQVGQPVVAIGSPLGLSGTVTSGIVSALNRPVNTTASQQETPGSGGGSSATTTVIDAVQTDAAINPGNSGGPLVNMQGEVVGINSAIASLGSGGSSSQSGSIGVGFSIPIDEAKPITDQLIQMGHAVHAVLGVSPTDATNSNGIVQLGARVVTVSAGSPAAVAGLKPGDVVTQVDDRPIDTADALVAAIRSHQPGAKVSVTYSRNGQKNTVTVTLASAS